MIRGPGRKRLAKRTLGSIMTTFLWATSASSQVQLDLDSFFRRCPRLTEFVMDGQDRARASRQTALSERARSTIRDLADEWRRADGTDLRHLAYIIATARRETAGTWLPIREASECGADERCRERAVARVISSSQRNYAMPERNGRRYYGRGYSQITFRENYAIVDRRLRTGTRFVDNPDLVMDPAIARTILVRSMLEGWFGSERPLSFYLNDRGQDWINARNNINPRSRRKPIISSSAQEIHRCLTG